MELNFGIIKIRSNVPTLKLPFVLKIQDVDELSCKKLIKEFVDESHRIVFYERRLFGKTRYSGTARWARWDSDDDTWFSSLQVAGALGIVEYEFLNSEKKEKYFLNNACATKSYKDKFTLHMKEIYI